LSVEGLRVLARPAAKSRGNNPYTWLLYSRLRERGVQVDEYSLPRAFTSRYDICHVHWPESTFNASLPEALITTQSLLLATDRLRARGARLVWTAHNLAAHERRFPRAEAAFWRAFTRRVDAFISLSESAAEAVRERFPELATRPSFVVPHPHYRGEYPDEVTREQARELLAVPRNARVLLFFGRVMQYKNVPALIDVVRRLPREIDARPLLLLVAGHCHDRAVERAIRAAAAEDTRIRLDLRRIPNDEVQRYFRAADLVVLPYREILNSGSAVLSLSFDRPVLLPSFGSGRDLAATVGSDWVQLFDQLSPETLLRALERTHALPASADGQQLTALAPERIAAQTEAAFRQLVRARP
jgi:glycosyltransferase involved in cell wall biosynthesis